MWVGSVCTIYVQVYQDEGLLTVAALGFSYGGGGGSKNILLTDGVAKRDENR